MHSCYLELLLLCHVYLRFIPHLTRIPNHCRHGGINNNIARDMKIGYAFITVHHSKIWSGGIDGIDFIGNFLFYQQADYPTYLLNHQIRYLHPLPNIHRIDFHGCQKFLEIHLNRMSKDDGVANLHHCRFHMKRKQNALIPCIFNLMC